MSKLIIPAGLPLAPKTAFANENAFADTFLSQPLTEYSLGWLQDHAELVKTLDFLAPKVRAARRFEFRAANGKSAFAAAESGQDIRSLGAEFNVYRDTGDIIQGKTLSKGLTKVLDKDEVADNPMAEEEAVAEIMAILVRSEIIRAFGLLAAAATNEAKTWTPSSGTGVDADADILAALAAGGTAAGLDPNRVFFGQTAWQLRVTTLRSLATAAGFSSAGLDTAGLAGLLGVDDVMVCKQRYQTGSGKSALTTANVVLAYNAQSGAGRNDPSNIKRFVTPVKGGDYTVFREEKPATVAVTVAHCSNVVLTSSAGIRKLTIS